MRTLVKLLMKSHVLDDDLDYHLMRASMVILFAFSDTRNGSSTRPGHWFPTSAMVRSSPGCTPCSGSGELPGSSESGNGRPALILLGFWEKRLGVLGAAGACASFVAIVTIIPFMPDGWAASAGGFPAMTDEAARKRAAPRPSGTSPD